MHDKLNSLSESLNGLIDEKIQSALNDKVKSIQKKKVGRPSNKQPGIKYKADSFILPEPLIHRLKLFVALSSEKNINKSSVIEAALTRYLNETP